MTDTQINKLIKKINPDGVTFTYLLPLTKDNTLYAESSLKGKYGTKIIDQIKKSS